MLDTVVIRRLQDVAVTPALIAGIDDIFFASSATQSFAGDAERAAFRDRWLGRYIAHDSGYVFLALRADGAVGGYLVGSIDDPATAPRFSDIAHFQTFAHLTARFPAQLHVNIAQDLRGGGVGKRLVDHFIAAAEAVSVAGVHVVTTRGARNVRFYQRNGFAEVGSTGADAHCLVLLARELGA